MLTRFLATAATLLTAAGLAAEMPAGLRIAFDQAAHNVERDGAGHKAYNPKQQYGMSFQESAAFVRLEEGELRMQLAGWGRRLAMRTPAAPVVSAEGNRVQYRHGEITEWYINDARGLEQGFTLNARPGGEGPLTMALAVTGDWTPSLESGGEVVLERGGHTALRYGALKAWDAAGRPLPSRMEVEGREIRLMVDDAGARYPVTIDPLIQRAKLTASTPFEYLNRFGCSVAISSDTAVVGACGYANNGSVEIFVRSGNTWIWQQKLTASNGPAPTQFGVSVAISGDTMVIGANADSSSTGAAYVFVRSAGVWSEQQRLTASDHANGDLFGNAVAVDGDTAVVGAPGDDSSMGSAYVFTRSGSTWNQTQKVVSVTRGKNYLFGTAVAMEGSTLVVGESGYSSSRGDVYVFVMAGGVWSVQGQVLVNDGVANDLFGSAVALSGDTLVAGASGHNASRGVAYGFVRSGAVWTFQRAFDSPDGANDRFGFTVAVSGDLVVIGAPGNSVARGAAYLFARSGTSWSWWQKLTASDGVAGDSFGYFVALRGDVVLIGATYNNLNTGSVYAFSAPVASISANVPGLQFTTSGAAGSCPGAGVQTAPVDLHWVSNSSCTIALTNSYSEEEGQRYVFQWWADNHGAGSTRLLTAPAVDIGYSVVYVNQNLLTVAVNPVWAGSVTGAGWYDSNVDAVVTAVPVSGTVFTGFSGDLTGFPAPSQISMTTPRSVTGSFAPTPLANLSASIIAKSGPQAARVWTIALSNAGPGIAIGGQLHGIQLTQTFGAACLPLRLAPAFPVAFANFGAGQAVATPVTINFTGCPDNARFTAAFTYSANSGGVVGLSTILNQTR